MRWVGRSTRQHHQAPRRARRGEAAFTLVEIMLAIFIFAGVVAAIYASWSAILRSSRAGLTAAADAQRRRIAILALEEALNSAQMFGQNAGYYSFLFASDRDGSLLEFVARLPPSYPRSGRFQDKQVRRVRFTVEPDANGLPALELRQRPLLSDWEDDERDNPLVLARDVRLFTLEFWGPRSKEWETEWLITNQLPRMVRFTLGVGSPNRRELLDEDIVTRVVVLPSAGVPAAMQAPAGTRGAPPPAVGPGGPPGAGPGGRGGTGTPGNPSGPPPAPIRRTSPRR
jgi:type II secretory pathway component PulJ